MTASGEPPSIKNNLEKLRFDAGDAPKGKESVRAVYLPTNAPVSVSAVSRSEAERLRPWAGVKHAHLAKLVEIIDVDGDSYLAIVEAPAGELLAERLRSIGKKHPVDAVRTALRVADALNSLHEAGGSHGRLHPGTVLLAPEQGPEPLVLFGAPGSREYWPPDSSVNEPPSALTDTWAAGALLYHMLTGSMPPSLGVGAADELTPLGIDNPLLREAVAHVLNKDKHARATTLQPLRRELARWFVEHVGEEPGPHSVASHKPPPLPASLRPVHGLASAAGRARQSLAPSRGGALKRYLILALVAGVLGLGASYTISALRKPKRVVVEHVLPGAPAKEAASVEPGAIDLAEVPVTGKEGRTGDSVTTCIAGFLPENALSKQANLATFCPASDLRQAIKTLRAGFANSAGGGVGTPKGWNDLGWFEFAALGTLRAGCCNNPPKFVWPVNTSPDCPSIGDALDVLGKAVGSNQEVDAAIARFREAAHCEVAKGKPDLSRPNSEPSAEAERIFREIFHIGSP
jgi:hypothetical protein